MISTKHASFNDTHFLLVTNVQENDDVVINLENQLEEEESYSEQRRSPLYQRMHQPVMDSIENREKNAKGTNELVKQVLTGERIPNDVENVGEIPTITGQPLTQKHGLTAEWSYLVYERKMPLRFPFKAVRIVYSNVEVRYRDD